MLPRTRSIPKKSWSEVMNKGVSYHTPHLSLRLAPAESQTHSKFSFVVPKKVEKTAVGRNKIRRKGLAMLRQALPSVPSGWFGIFITKSGSAELSSLALKAEITELVARIKAKTSGQRR